MKELITHQEIYTRRLSRLRKSGSSLQSLLSIEPPYTRLILVRHSSMVLFQTDKFMSVHRTGGLSRSRKDTPSNLKELCTGPSRQPGTGMFAFQIG
jgi:hypothetical protein